MILRVEKTSSHTPEVMSSAMFVWMENVYDGPSKVRTLRTLRICATGKTARLDVIVTTMEKVTCLVEDSYKVGP